MYHSGRRLHHGGGGRRDDGLALHHHTFGNETISVLRIVDGDRHARANSLGWHNGARFVVTVPNDGKSATAANGGTIGFNIGDPKLAEAWHKAGVANGGTSIEDPPGVRPNGAYLAYLRDPDGNKLVAVARPAS